MNEQELDKFVENQYNEWLLNNDISKVEDIDQKDLKEAIEKDLAFVSKMTVQEYTLYEKWIEVHEKYKTAETNSFFDDKPALIDPTQEAFIKSVKNSNVIDVRTKNEFNNGTYKASQNIPLSTIEQEIDNISDNSYVFCAGGYRSVIACSILMKAGKKDLINVLEGYSGINKHIESQL